MTKEHLINRVAVLIEHTKDEIRKAGKLKVKYEREGQTLFKRKPSHWRFRYLSAAMLENHYHSEQQALIRQLHLLKGVLR